ncbi:hypothetical protein BGZ51_008544 [Haplosporangium sp. Z 767]|nr:hypothetical protein BGZ51_008544 [Haplosporangium sp. Z 767]KAF9196856.1 hypothetical protein BGZ50_005930 [Haplosporangium sp. Z 11]
MGIVSLVRSMWALLYATTSFVVLLLTGAAINGTSTKNGSVNVMLSLLGCQMSELPLTVLLMDVFLYTWLNVTGTFQQSTLARFFNYVNVITAIGLLYLFKRSYESKLVAQKFLDQLTKESRGRVTLPGLNAPRFWQQLLNPLYWPKNCTIYENIPYWTEKEQLSALRTDGWQSVLQMALDVYQPNTIEGGDERPVLMYIHGGGWTSGTKSLPGTLLTEMISHEWIVVSIDYRLVTKAGYPTQLEDCKRALRWVKDEIRIFGGNPNNIIVAGDSAGGHLAALLALTMNLKEYQPGFENVDTTIQGCVAQSALVDLMDVKGYRHHESRTRFIKEVSRREGSAETQENLKFLTEHSPLYRVADASVPFLIVHGDLDIVAPSKSARDFVQEFRAKSKAPIDHLEMPGGHHCFNMFSSPRTWYTTIATAEWLNNNFGRSSQQPDEKKKQVHELVEWGWTE